MSRPRVESLFARLEAAPVPRARCPHLAHDASTHPRLLTSWEQGRISCPACSRQERAVALAEKRDCPGCWQPAETLLTAHREGGAITLLVGLCPACWDRDTDQKPRRDANSAPIPAPRTETPARVVWSSR